MLAIYEANCTYGWIWHQLSRRDVDPLVKLPWRTGKVCSNGTILINRELRQTSLHFNFMKTTRMKRSNLTLNSKVKKLLWWLFLFTVTVQHKLGNYALRGQSRSDLRQEIAWDSKPTSSIYLILDIQIISIMDKKCNYETPFSLTLQLSKY
jgi:hypothetical protein